jgi:hypothetical protein
LLSVMDKEYSVYLASNGSHDVSLLQTDHHIGFRDVMYIEPFPYVRSRTTKIN